MTDSSPAHRLESLPTDIETPVGLVDLTVTERNLRNVSEYCRTHDLGWRPHIKTHKSLRVARMQLQSGALGLTVATLREAEVMSSLTDDLLLAYPPVGEAKLRRLLALPESVRLKVALDSALVLEPLARAAHAAGRSVAVLVELDAGLGRVGVQTPHEALGLASQARDLDGVTFGGLMFYPGHLRLPPEDQTPGLRELADRLEGFYAALEAEGLTPDIVSGGSSPTLWRSHELSGLTEVRPGTCVFNDRDMVHLEVCDWDDCAYTVLATVVSTAVPGRAVIDAGSKALSKEAIRTGDAPGYGVLRGHLDVAVLSLSEEHGVLDLSRTDWTPRVGERVEVIPNHVCLSVNLQDHLLVERSGETELWRSEARGREPYRPA